VDDTIKENEMGRVWAMYWGKENTYRGLVVKSEGIRPHGRSKHRWDDNIKMGLKGRAWPELIWLRIRACVEFL